MIPQLGRRRKRILTPEAWAELDRLRHVEKLSQAEAGKRMGLSHAGISRLEKERTAIVANGQPALPEHPLIDHPTETFRGFVIAEILSDAIDAYAAAGHLQVKDVLDLALREWLIVAFGEMDVLQRCGMRYYRE
jgi:DNA-binding XRE family transcriptional regulator